MAAGVFLHLVPTGKSLDGRGGHNGRDDADR